MNQEESLRIGPALNDDRAVYEFIKAFGFKNENITKFNVVSENKLGSSNSYGFNFNNTANETYGKVVPTEIRLNPKDVFFCYRMGIFVSRRTVDAAGVPNAYGIRRTYGNPKVYPGAEAASINNLYAGKFNLDIGSTKLYIDMPMDMFWRVPMFEENEAVSTVAITGVKSFDDFELDAFYRQAIPSFWITGDDAATLEVSVNQGITISNLAAAAQGTENALITVLKGYKVANASGTFDKILKSLI